MASVDGIAEDKSHQAVSSYFIGPQAENLGDFKENIESILNELQKTRNNYFPDGTPFITQSIRESKTFQDSKRKISNAVTKAAQLLGKHSLPCWSPRYQAHMSMDMSMPALLGYFMTMIYNPNNVTIEASPLTTVAEIECGEQLCKMFGYNIDQDILDQPVGWGHITCGGTVANLESIWVARNLKFYPFSIVKAMQEGGMLSFLAPLFRIDTCVGTNKLLMDLTTWELLNLKPKEVLDIPQRLGNEFGISPAYMEKVLEQYSIQETGKDTLEIEFDIKPGQYMLSNTRHYSWPKGAAIAGIGASNVIGIEVDHGARLRLDKLEEELNKNLANQQAVYAVVAIIGSTEEGCVDSLRGVLALRKKFQEKGLSFLVHADAAWGGYFASMLPTEYQPGEATPIPLGGAPPHLGAGFVPDSSLRVETQEDLFALRFADSITVDPHKAGYMPYPAGGLCYRDERMRYLVTWTSPYLSRGAVTSMGIYGVEGSKPGAAAMSTWLSNKCIGMGPDGYGALLGEVTFTCSRFAAEWAAMSTDDMDFRVVPLNMLPSELKEGTTLEKVEAEKKLIRETILCRSNAEIVMADSVEQDEDKKALPLLRALGSDLNINAFALNFRLTPGKDGVWNTDVEEANYLMSRVVERLSVDSPEDDPSTLEFVLTSTMFSKKLYDHCASNFKDRLALKRDDLDLMVLRNVVMNPFPTENNFVGELAGIFKRIVEEEVKICQQRNSLAPAQYEFLLQGKTKLHLVHLPSFHIENHRQQIIVEITIDEASMAQYLELKNANPSEIFTLITKLPIHLPDHLTPGSTFEASIKTKDAGPIMESILVTTTTLLHSHPLNSTYRDATYPSNFTPFYLYGTPDELHIDHILLRSPNTQLSAEDITLTLSPPLSPTDLASGLILTLNTVYEEPMQPFPTNTELHDSSSFFFKEGAKLGVEVWKDVNAAEATGPGLVSHVGDEKYLVGRGEMVLGKGVWVDSESMNRDPLKAEEKVVKWREEFDKIGAAMDA